MYSLPYFKEKDHAEVLAFMKAHPFITLCGADGNGKPVATQVPVLVKEHNTALLLEGHMMRNTDHHLALLQNAEALVLFTGAHAYVSASWYVKKNVASTWNYMAVHARGQLHFLDETSLLRILAETTAHFENDPGSPALVEKMPADYVSRLSKDIVAFEIPVTSIDHVFKLSQNHHRENRQAIVAHLEQSGADRKEIASEMKKRST